MIQLSDVALFFDSLLLAVPAVAGVILSALLAAFGGSLLFKRRFLIRFIGAGLAIIGIMSGVVIGFYLVFVLACYF